MQKKTFTNAHYVSETTKNIDFLTSDVIWLLSNIKITFSQGGVTDLQIKHLAPRLMYGVYKLLTAMIFTILQLFFTTLDPTQCAPFKTLLQEV